MAATNFMETDIFRYLEESNAGMTKRMKAIIGDPKATIILNEKLASTLDMFERTFREAIVLKATMAIRSGKLVLFWAKPEVNLPECLPFFRYTKNGNTKVAVNMTNIAVVTGDGDDALYSVEDMRRFYAMVIGAYIQLTIQKPSDLPVKAMEYGCMLWARMFCKILNSTIGLSTNKDQYSAFFYFACRFFLVYYIDAPKATVESISKAVLRNGEGNPYINKIEEYFLEDPNREVRFYANFTGFCEVLFNNEITSLKSLRIAMADPNTKLNMSFYLRKFIDMYYQSAILSLSSVYYFMWALLCTQKRAFMVNVKALANVLDQGNDIAKFFASVYTEAEARG